MKARMLCLVVFLFGAGLAIATCPQPVKKIVSDQFVQPVLAVPSYGAGYADSSPVLQKILETLERIEAKLDGQAVRNTTLESVIASKCANCHTAGRLAPDSKFVMVEADGKLSPLSVEQKKMIKLRIETTDLKIMMPKGGKPLSDTEKAVLLGAQ